MLHVHTCVLSNINTQLMHMHISTYIFNFIRLIKT